MYLKQHRKGTMQLDGRKLKGQFNVSLTNQGDREVLMEFIKEMKKQLVVFDPTKKKKRVGARRKTRR